MPGGTTWGGLFVAEGPSRLSSGGGIAGPVLLELALDPCLDVALAVSDVAALWPKMSLRDYETARDAARGDAERKAARRLGVPPLDLSVAAHGRYGRSFSDERDRRVAEAAPEGAAPRTLQALRGHVTRAMVAELAPALEKWRGG